MSKRKVIRKQSSNNELAKISNCKRDVEVEQKHAECYAKSKKRKKVEGDMEVKGREIFEARLREIKKREYEGINEKDEEGVTMMHLAANFGNAELIETLIAKGGDVNEEDDCGRKPIHFAAMGNKREIAKVLIEEGIDIDPKTNGGYTPLHYACLMDGEAVVRELINRGVDVNPVNRFGITPMYYANGIIKKVLENQGGKIKDKLGEITSEIENMKEKRQESVDRIMQPIMKEKVVSIEEIRKGNEEVNRLTFI